MTDRTFKIMTAGVIVVLLLALADIVFQAVENHRIRVNRSAEFQRGSVESRINVLCEAKFPHSAERLGECVKTLRKKMQVQ